MSFQCELAARFTFDAAHFMPNFPEGHPNRRLHGHSYVAEVQLEGAVDPNTGCVIEHSDLMALIDPVRNVLDHGYLNEVSGLGLPTSENIARWIWDSLAETSLRPLLVGVAVERSSVGVRAVYRGLGS